MFKFSVLLQLRFHELFLWIHCHKFSFINSISRIRFHEFNLRIRKYSKNLYEFALLRFGSFLRNQCYVANGLHCSSCFTVGIQACHVFQAFLGNCVPSFQAFQENPLILLNKITLSWNPSFLAFLGIYPRNPWIFAPLPSFWKSLDFSDSLEIFQEKSKEFPNFFVRVLQMYE